jgi:hypothetical protein
MNKLLVLRWLGVLLLALAPTVGSAAQERTKFDHLTTGFELIGKHRDLPCESCHVNAIFKGTPRSCASCHGAGTEVRASAKPADHILSSDRCESCHTPVAFRPAVNFDHIEVRGNCSTCHNNVQAQGKGPTHIVTDLECNACHSTIGWAGARFAHTGVTDNCASCHDGISATGMPATHIPTAAAGCESCHSTTTFTTFAGTPMNHTVVAALSCSTCHEAGMRFAGAPPVVTRPGVPHPVSGECSLCHLDTISFKNGNGKPANHIPTAQTCTLCHSNAADYSIYAMNHQGISSNCAQCHASGLSFANLAPPQLKQPPTNHIPFGTAACESCHAATNFTTFVVANTSPPMNHAVVAGVACATCHASGLSFAGSPATVAPPVNHIPFAGATCNSCHSATNFTTFRIANTSPPMNHTVVSALPCSTCHEVGRSFVGTPPTVLRPPLMASGGVHPSAGECSSCHNSTTSFKGASIYPTDHIPLPQGASANCTACHANANNYTSYVMDHSVVPGATCTTCHGAGKAFANMAPPVLKVPPGNHVPFGAANCESCHAATNFTTFAMANTSPPMNHAVVASMSCDTCHARGKTFVGAPATVVEPGNHIPIGATPCQNCHSPTNFSSFVIPNAVPPMNHAGFTTNCISCHGAGLVFVGSPPVKLIPANHVPTGSIACEGCHSSSNFATFVIPNASGSAPPSMVHSLVGSIACSSCHEAGRSFVGSPPVKLRPALKASGSAHVPGGECSTCHFSTVSFAGASDLPANHIPLPAADANNCALCHSNPANYSVGTMNHVNITSNCAQCHAAGLSFANMAPPTLKVPPSNHVPFGTAACESCHAAANFTTFAITNKSPPMNHSVVSAMSCNTCHARGLTFVGTPATVVEPATHIPTGATPCQNCHSATNFSTFAIANDVPPMNHTGFTTNCIACHGAGLTFIGTPPVKLIPSNHVPTGTIACEGCHSSSNFSTFVIPNASGAAPPSMVHSRVTAIACSVCHEAGKSFVGSPAVKVRPALKANGSAHVAGGECNTCHLGTTSFAGATDLPPNHIPLPAADNNNCALCHTTGNYTQYVMNHVNITSNCLQCHAYGLSFANMAAPELIAPPAGATGHIPTNPPTGTLNLACELCHSASTFNTFAGTVMKHTPVRAMACTACHERGMTWKTNSGVRLWVRPSGHHGTQDCDGSGCHSTRDKMGVRQSSAAIQPTLKASGVANVAAVAAAGGGALGQAGAFNHRRAIGSSCVSCHGPESGMGKSATHLPASNNCESCHSTLVWLPVARVDHLQVSGSCVSCHNTTLARGKTSSHISSDNSCATCHTTNAWTPARFDHGAVTAATCNSCHNGLRASGLPVNHIPTSQQCDSCHGALGWKPAKLDHATLTANCGSCHNNAVAIGMAATHMGTQRDCATCHNYPDWAAIRFKHASVNYPGDHKAAPACAACHTSNTDQVPYASPADTGTCASCHSKDFKPDLHAKTSDGQKYTATELGNCAGACHVYSDAALTTVAKSVGGPYHRVTDAAFKH